MSGSNNDGGLLILGSGIIIVIMGMALSKALKKLFIQLEQALTALGSMIGTFFEVSFVFLVKVAWVALIFAVIICALWFARSFVDLLKNGKKVMKYSKQVTDKCMDHTDNALSEFESTFKNSLSSYQSKLNYLEHKLEEAMKPPEVQAEVIGNEDVDASEETESEEINDAINPY